MIGSLRQKQSWLILSCSATAFALLPGIAQSHPATAPTEQIFNIADSTPHAGEHSGHTHPDHAHPAIEIPVTQPLPTVSLLVHPDAKKGWNLEVRVTNFVFAPGHINQASSNPREGHAHLYIDGKKVTRLYGGWYYLESLPPGEHTIRVTLNANNHAELMHQGKPIEAIATIKVP